MSQVKVDYEKIDLLLSITRFRVIYASIKSLIFQGFSIFLNLLKNTKNYLNWRKIGELEKTEMNVFAIYFT